MVLTLYGHPQSMCTNRVRITLGELGLPYELVKIELSKGEQRAPEYLANHPFGQAPYLDDDGFIIYESRAICRYLALSYGGIGKLIPDPTDVKKMALFEQAVSVEMCNFDAYASVLAFENLTKPMLGLDTDKVTVERFTDILDQKLAAYEQILGKTKYLAGNELTLADLFHIPYGTALARQNIDFLESGKYPNVTKWWKDVSSNASWRKISEAWA